ncbi:unnamed protein product [Sphagnum balticum]
MTTELPTRYCGCRQISTRIQRKECAYRDAVLAPVPNAQLCQLLANQYFRPSLHNLITGLDTLDVRFDYFIPGVQYNSVYTNMSRSTYITLNTPSKLWQVSATIYNGVDDLTTTIPVRKIGVLNEISGYQVNIMCYVLAGISLNCTYPYNGQAQVQHSPELATGPAAVDNGLVLAQQDILFNILFVNGTYPNNSVNATNMDTGESVTISTLWFGQGHGLLFNLSLGCGYLEYSGKNTLAKCKTCVIGVHHRHTTTTER